VSDELGVGVIGASLRRGWGGITHLPSIEALPGLRLAAVCASSIESAEATAARYGAHPYTDAMALVADPSVDIVTVVVRSSIHHDLVKAALAAGKHVYCEWPLVETSDKGRELRDLAIAAGVHTAVGLQARCSPAVLKARDLIAAGFLGDVVSATAQYASVTNGGGVDSSRAYMVKASTGVGLLEIHGGHVLDALAFCLGGFASVSAMLAVRYPTVTVQDTGERVTRTAPDQILVNAVMESGAVTSVHIQGGKLNDNGFRLQVQGTDGDLDLRTRGNHGVQIEQLALSGAKGRTDYAHHDTAGHRFRPSAALSPIEVEEVYTWIPPLLREQPFYNTAQLYAQLANDIRSGSRTVPDFGTAVELLELIEAVKASAADDSRQTAPLH
jgi:predicted dehydrogenase